MQSHRSSGAVIKPTVEQSHLPCQLVTAFMPVFINGSAVTMPVVMLLQLTNSTLQLQPECIDVINNSEFSVLPSSQVCTGRAAVATLIARYEQEKNALLKEALGLKHKTLYRIVI
jgi:hypothetical protein